MTVLPKYQTIIKRALAGSIDGLVFLPFTWLTGNVIDDPLSNSDVWWNLLQTILWSAYVIVGHGKFGQTLGKKVMAVKFLI